MKVVFLDRDGVLNQKAPEKLPDGSTGYIRNWSEFHWLPGAKQALKILKDKGYRVIVVSNQHGVFKGLYTKEDVWEIERNLQAELQKDLNIQIDAFYNCFHGKDEGCNCRKPKPGMILQGLGEAEVTPSTRSPRPLAGEGVTSRENVYMVGDSVNDILAGKEGGVKTIFLTTRSSVELKEELEKLQKAGKPDFIADSLLKAAQEIL